MSPPAGERVPLQQDCGFSPLGRPGRVGRARSRAAVGIHGTGPPSGQRGCGSRPPRRVPRGLPPSPITEGPLRTRRAGGRGEPGAGRAARMRPGAEERNNPPAPHPSPRRELPPGAINPNQLPTGHTAAHRVLQPGLSGRWFFLSPGRPAHGEVMRYLRRDTHPPAPSSAPLRAAARRRARTKAGGSGPRRLVPAPGPAAPGLPSGGGLRAAAGCRPRGRGSGERRQPGQRRCRSLPRPPDALRPWLFMF